MRLTKGAASPHQQICKTRSFGGNGAAPLRGAFDTHRLPIMVKKRDSSRLACVDGLRGIAILLVLGFHYLSAPPTFDLYPYGNAFASLPILKDGGQGVDLFFIISGFVIALTLEKCRGPYEFFVRRFARIWPPLLVCSILTFSIINVTASPYSVMRAKMWADFLPSLTLTPNFFWSGHFPGVDLIDGVYWTLLVEAYFYVIAAIIYWSFDRANIARNLVIFTFANLMCRAILHRLMPGSNVIYSIFLIPDFMPWFAAGAVFYEMFMERISVARGIIFLSLMFAVIVRMSTFEQDPLMVSALALAFFVFFYLVAMRSSLVRIFEGRWLVLVGLCSYSVYLIHNAIGMVVISSIPRSLPTVLQLVLVLMLAVGMIVAGWLLFVSVEQPFRRFITKGLLRRPAVPTLQTE